MTFKAYYYFIGCGILAAIIAFYKLRYKFFKSKYEQKKLDFESIKNLLALAKKSRDRKIANDLIREKNEKINSFDPDNPWDGLRRK